MAVPQIREVQIEALFQYGGLQIEGEYMWQASPNKFWLRIEIPVRNTKSASLKLCITACQECPERFRFALLYNTTLPIRRLCAGLSHKNKHTNRDSWTTETHLHKWNDRCQDRFAVSTEISTESIQEALEQFCAECNIECSATIADMPSHQPEMLL
jgi:hypothetical protein